MPMQWHVTKCGGTHQNGDNLRINRAHLRISDHCSVTVRVMVTVSIRVRLVLGLRNADCCIQTAGESDKMRISHVIKTDQWPSDPHIRILSCPHCNTLGNIILFLPPAQTRQIHSISVAIITPTCSF